MAFDIRPEMTLRPSAAGADSYTLMIHGDIGESWWGESVSAKSVVAQLKGLKPNTALTIRINSFGGSVVDGLAIYNTLMEHAGTKSVIVDGIAASAASLIAMAGDTIEMPETSLMMIHGPWTQAAGNANELRTTADVLDKFADSMIGAYARKSGKAADEIRTMLQGGDDHWYTGAEAVAAGFADSVKDFGATSNAKAFLARATGSVKFAAMAAYRAAAMQLPPSNPESTMPNTIAAEVTEPLVEVVAEPEGPSEVAPVIEPVAAVVAAVDPAAVEARLAAAVAAAVAEVEARAAASVAAAEALAVEARAKLDAEIEAREVRDAVEAFTRDFAFLPGTAEANAKAMRSLMKAQPEAAAVIRNVLASVNVMLSDAKAVGMAPIGSTGAVVASLDERISMLAAEKQKSNPSMTIEQARSLVYTENPDLAVALRAQKD
jgi:ATP-dependent protease ClpP protease subunit